VCRVQRERTIRGKKTTEVCYYVTSLERTAASADQLLAIARKHWGAIENGVHYVRDETLGEDRSTIYRGHAPQNLAALRNAGLNALRSLGTDNFAATLRSFARNPFRLFTKLGYPN
jgi:predicted transposase YbfD/YdcC